MRLLQYLKEQKVPKDVPLKYVIKTFGSFGFNVIRETPHVIMRGEKGKTVVIPNHKQIKSTTLRKIIGEGGLDREEFLKRLDKFR